MRMRVLLNEMSRTVWQCDACGMLYMDNGHRQLRAFRPAGDEDVLGILSGR